MSLWFLKAFRATHINDAWIFSFSFVYLFFGIFQQSVYNLYSLINYGPHLYGRKSEPKILVAISPSLGPFVNFLLDFDLWID